MEEEDCPICCEEYTKKVRKIVSCYLCKKNICLNCLKKYILKSTLSPHCMHCKREFSSEWLDLTFSKSFRDNDLRKHRISLLLEQEKSMLPYTLIILERDLLVEKSIELVFKIKSLLDTISPRSVNPIGLDIVNTINNLKNELKVIYQEMEEKGVVLNDKKKVQIILKCPECTSGFLDSKNECLQCKTKVCNKCFISKKENHVCKEEDILTFKMLQNETKPCPNCSARIQKTDGCNQMWCTSCNTAFDWATLTKINGTIHNPHFQEYLNRNQITNNNWLNNCENNNDPFYFPHNNSYGLSTEMLNYIIEPDQVLSSRFRSKMSQIIGFIIQRSFNGAHKRVEYNRDLYLKERKSFLLNQIDEKKFFSLLSSKETVREKERKFSQLDELIINIAKDIIGICLQQKYTTYELLQKNLIDPMDKARIYYNEQYAKLCKDFQVNNCREFKSNNTVHICENWFFTRQSTTT